MIAALWKLVQAQPVAFGAVVRLGILCGVSFGLAWTAAQITAVMTFVEALIGFLTWHGVTANPNTSEPKP